MQLLPWIADCGLCGWLDSCGKYNTAACGKEKKYSPDSLCLLTGLIEFRFNSRILCEKSFRLRKEQFEKVWKDGVQQKINLHCVRERAGFSKHVTDLRKHKEETNLFIMWRTVSFSKVAALYELTSWINSLKILSTPTFRKCGQA